MSKTTVVETRCDLCGYVSPYPEPRGFVDVDGVDLCAWCSTPDRGPGVTECGRHRVTITTDGWSCSCGSSRTLATLRVLVTDRVLAAVPSIVQATAYIHAEER